MKKSNLLIFILPLILTIQLPAQKITRINYVTAGGQEVIFEKTWASATISQEFSSRETPEGIVRNAIFAVGWGVKLSAVAGEIIIKDVKGAIVDKALPDRPSKPLAAGSYNADVLINFGEWGKVQFNMTGVEIKDPPPVVAASRDAKPAARSTTTTVKLGFNLPMVKFEKKPADFKGKARYEAVTWWALEKKEDYGYIGYPVLLPPGVKDVKKKVAGAGAERWGTVQPGSYDLFLTVDTPSLPFIVRVPGWKLESNVNHTVHLVMNGGAVMVKEPGVPHAIHFYPPGTAAAQKKLDREPKKEITTIEKKVNKAVCPPGTYDILYNFGWGSRYEWKPGVRINVGEFVELPGSPVAAAAAPPAALPAAPAGAAQPAVKPAPAGVFSFDQGVARPDKALRASGDTYFKADDEVLAAFFAPERFEGDFALAKLLTPASERTKGESEVLVFYDNQKRWTPFIISRSRPAKAEELKPDMLVLAGSTSGRRNFDKWFMGIVKDLSDLYKNEVILLKYNHDAKPSLLRTKLAGIRIIEEPVFRFQVLDGRNYMRVK